MQEFPVVMQDILSRRNTGSPTAFADAAHHTAVAVPHFAAAAYQASPWAFLDTAARGLAPDPTAGPQAVLAGKELACWLALLLPWS